MWLTRGLIDLIFPPRCVFCRDIIRADQQGVCTKCGKELPFIYGTGRRSEGEFFERCVSPFRYKDDVRRSLLNFKFHNKRMYAVTYGRILADCVNEEYEGQFDLVTWVPVSARRRRKRGYDQARLLAESTAECLAAPCAACLEKPRDNPAQSTLRTEAERRGNVLGSYTAIGDVAGRRVLLIDDIVTTASTLGEASRTLLMAGADCVLCATLAKSELKGKKKN